VPARSAFDYAVVRVVPRVEREEFVNAGIIVFCHDRDALLARIALDELRLLALHPATDLEAVRAHLAAMVRVCRGGEDAGPIGQLPLRERWRWLTAPRSTVIQTSPAHVGLADDIEAVLGHLFETLCTSPRVTA
jgi:hypothetical protein